MYSSQIIFFIGPLSDHWLAQLVSQSDSQFLLLLRPDWCDPGEWRFTQLLKKSTPLCLTLHNLAKLNHCAVVPLVRCALGNVHFINIGIPSDNHFEDIKGLMWPQLNMKYINMELWRATWRNTKINKIWGKIFKGKEKRSSSHNFDFN